MNEVDCWKNGYILWMEASLVTINSYFIRTTNDFGEQRKFKIGLQFVTTKPSFLIVPYSTLCSCLINHNRLHSHITEPVAQFTTHRIIRMNEFCATLDSLWLHDSERLLHLHVIYLPHSESCSLFYYFKVASIHCALSGHKTVVFQAI